MKVLLKENNQVKWVEEVEAGDPILTKRQKFKTVNTYKWSAAKTQTVPANACPPKSPGIAVPGGTCSVLGDRYNTGLCMQDGSSSAIHTYYDCIFDKTVEEPDGFELVWDKSSDTKSRLIKEGTVVGWRNIKPPLGGIEFRYRIRKYDSTFGAWQTIMVEPRDKEVSNAGNWGYYNPVKVLTLNYNAPQLSIGGTTFYTMQGASSVGDQIEISLPPMSAFGTFGATWDMRLSDVGSFTDITLQVTTADVNSPLYVIPYGMTFGTGGDFASFDYVVED